MASSGLLHTLLLAALLLPLLYLRFRRTFGRQRVSRRRLLVRVVLLALVGVLVLVSSLAAFSPLRLIEAVIGLAAGAAAALYGLRLTRFEESAGEAYFTPNAYLGLAVFGLFLARLAYRFLFLGLASGGVGGAPPAYDPVTGAILFVFVGYYVSYYLGVLKRSGKTVGEGS